MKRAREEKRKTEAVAERRRRALSLVVLFLFASCALLIFVVGKRAAAVTNVKKTNDIKPETKSAPSESTPSTPAQDYSKFSHFSPGEHAALASRYSCNICHQRRDNSAEPRLPGHRECINCHQTQFNTPGTPFCLICHTQESLSQQNPAVKAFPRSLAGFDAEYDHAQHMAGSPEARPQTGCVACHAPARRGVARTFPDGLAAHQTCYTCHTAGRQAGGRDISSCGVCHLPGGRAVNVSTATRSYSIGFSHATHGPRQNLSCENCHTVGRRGLPEGKQVTATFPAQHFPNTRAQTCATCHNGQRAFGETNFNDCKRCHTGPTFRL
ncbi:MAG TPA: cytochrome c3 family protein [Pyrinomonadaceae bacterium]|nr:cytochrome c3 family protein [Pyrinomonadaceae bacterium]